MVDNSTSVPAINPKIPDIQVPSEKVETRVSSRQKFRRAQLFLKGPLNLSWIRENIKTAADRLILVLVAHSDMKRQVELKVTAGILRDAGIENRKTGYRALKSLEASGVVKVRRKQGCRPYVTIVSRPSESNVSKQIQYR